ncbi:type IV pilus modification protein PilV [Neisseriaceae bacterium TC5R-5]|nr:type IV pilus modification protein PilV [Neisseriaceae bacterium TC5R-5]
MMTRTANSAGFTLLEVLVALLVIAVGLLGIAGLQAMAINGTNQSRLRGLAAIQANSLAAAMHANPAYWQNLTSTTTTAPTAGSCSSSVCTAAQMAGYDVQNWNSALQTVLTGGSGTFSCAPGASGPVACLITVSWREKVIGVNNTSNTAAFSTISYQLVVLP